MAKGRSLMELAEELDRQSASKMDVIADAARMDFIVKDERPSLALLNDDGVIGELGGAPASWPVSNHAAGQVAGWLGVPTAFERRLRSDHPALWSETLNTLSSAAGGDGGTARTVRTLDGQVRAVMSDRYRMLDNDELLRTALMPALADHMESDTPLRVLEGQVTPSRMYVKLVSPKVSAEVRRGDVVQAGLVVRNSEVGAGALAVELFTYRLVCTNGMIAQKLMRRTHLGGLNESGEDGMRIDYQDDTREALDAALWRMLRDAISSALSDDVFGAHVNTLRQAAGVEVIQPVRALEVVTKRYGLNGDEAERLQASYIGGSDNSIYGMAQALTSVAHTVSDYDRATDLQGFGGKLIEAEPSEWREVAGAFATPVSVALTTPVLNVVNDGPGGAGWQTERMLTTNGAR